MLRDFDRDYAAMAPTVNTGDADVPDISRLIVALRNANRMRPESQYPPEEWFQEPVFIIPGFNTPGSAPRQ